MKLGYATTYVPDVTPSRTFFEPTELCTTVKG